ncbi:hypothetical protein FKM82_020462 [Ascaphus truei]
MSQSLHLQIPESLLPDLSRIAGRSDAGELGRLLQLIVGCAVNCGNKQEHIHAIMRLEESVQHAVMTGIQEVMGKRTVDSVGELEKKVTSLQHDKDRLLAENQTLKEELSQTDTAKRPEAVEPQAYFQIQLQIGQLQEEKIRIEMTKDYYQAYCEELEKELIESRLWNVELENITKETAALKDEVDILRATTDKVTRLESEVEMCFRKLADLKDWLRQVKSMEELNLKYVHDVLYS